MNAMRRALLSVSDKTGLIELAQGLSGCGVELVASGGTADVLRAAGLAVTTVEDLTGLPSVLGGRVKTLHPGVFAGILARDTDENDVATMTLQSWVWFDLVVVNLYPFAETIARPGITEAEAIEKIDVGGPSLIRAAAKNLSRVTVLTAPADYQAVLEEIRAYGNTTPETRRALSLKAFATTAAYDAAIIGYFSGQAAPAGIPPALSVSLPMGQMLRYGENPHQQAALYAPPGSGALGGTLLQGKELSYNNLLDLDAAWAATEDFDAPTVVIVKHLNPCGIASGDDLPEAFRAALASDPVSAFGGVIAVNRTFDGTLAAALEGLFVEAIAAPAFTPEAIEWLAAHKKNCRLLRMDSLVLPAYSFRSVRGGVLAQTLDRGSDDGWQVVSQRQPTPAEAQALRFAWQACKHVKSNAIVIADRRATLGIGGGLPSRLDSVRLAVEKAGARAGGAVLASDAFFPFADGPQAALDAGVSALIQPGGSVRDAEVIEAVDTAGAAMVLTSVRHFRH